MSRPLRAVLLSACLVALVAFWMPPAGASGDGASTFLFPLSINGKSWQTDVIINPGVKPPIGKVNTKTIGDTLKGILPDFAADFLNLDPDGRIFLYYDGKTSWRIGTNASGDSLTTLTGQVANDGSFWMSGDYTFGPMLTDGKIFVQGKVKFAKGTYDPTKVSGNFYFVSGDAGTGLTLKFKTVGKPLAP